MAKYDALQALLAAGENATPEDVVETYQRQAAERAKIRLIQLFQEEGLSATDNMQFLADHQNEIMQIGEEEHLDDRRLAEAACAAANEVVGDPEFAVLRQL